MFTLTANGHAYEADLLVFDKDGLMFDSEQFWIEMANARMRALSEHCTTEQLRGMANLMGVRTETTPAGTLTATWVDPTGILAIAPPTEEVVLMAGFLVEKVGLVWHEARKLAAELFERSDADMDMTRALKPQPGYIELMTRINQLGLPYGVATSDTVERTKVSLERYGFWKNTRFVVISADVPQGKPEPDMLYYIEKKENVPTSRMVMIGDSYVDVKMAKAAGSIGIGVTPFADMREKMLPYATEIVTTLEAIRVDRA